MSDGLNETSMEEMTYGVQSLQDMLNDQSHGLDEQDDDESVAVQPAIEAADPQDDYDEAQSENLRFDVATTKQALDAELKKVDESDLSEENKRARRRELHREHVHTQAERLTGDKNPTLESLNAEIRKHKLSFLHEAVEHKGDVANIQKDLAEKYSQAVNEAIISGKTNEEIEDMLVELTNGRYVKGSTPDLQAFIDAGDFQAFFEKHVDVKDMVDVLLEAEDLQELKDELDDAMDEEEDVPGETPDAKRTRVDGIRARINEFFMSSKSSKADKAVGQAGDKIPMEALLDLVFLAQIKSGHFRSYSENMGWGAEPKDADKEKGMLLNLATVTADKAKFEGFLRVVLQKNNDVDMYQDHTLTDMDSFFENLKVQDSGRDRLLEGKQLFVLAFQKILNKSIPVEKIHFSHNVNEFIMVALKKHCSEAKDQKKQTPATTPNPSTP